MLSGRLEHVPQAGGSGGRPFRGAVLACGLASSLGYDATTACAAARAGIVRRSPLPYVYRATDDPEGQPAVGHTASLLTEGFVGAARWQRLLQGAVQDLAQRAPISRQPVCCGVFLGLPANLPGVPAERVGDPAAVLAFARDLWVRSVNAAACPLPGDVCFAEASGSPALASALAAALEMLRRGSLDMAVVGVVDSLVDVPVLQELDRNHRLKTEFNPDGLVPGEAAVVLLLAAEHGVIAKEARRLGYVARVLKLAADGAAADDGRATARIVHELFDGIRPPAPNAGRRWVLLDLNGEFGRSRDWGHALVRLVSSDRAFDDHELWHCADAFGDTGAANAGLALCVAAHAFARGHAPSPHAAVVTASDGARSGILFSAPETGGSRE